MDFPKLTSQRLILEPFSPAHSLGMFTLWSSSEVCRYSGDAVDWDGQPIRLPARDRSDSDKILDYFIRRAAAGTGIRWAMILLQTGDCIGAVGLNAVDPTPELAYHVHPDSWHLGYAREACQAVIDWAGANLSGRTIEAFIDEENASSKRLAEHLGFEAMDASRDGATRYERVHGRRNSRN